MTPGNDGGTGGGLPARQKKDFSPNRKPLFYDSADVLDHGWGAQDEIEEDARTQVPDPLATVTVTGPEPFTAPCLVSWQEVGPAWRRSTEQAGMTWALLSDPDAFRSSKSASTGLRVEVLERLATEDGSGQTTAGFVSRHQQRTQVASPGNGRVYNCRLALRVGGLSSTFGPETIERPDEVDLTNFLRTHHVVALNTWQDRTLSRLGAFWRARPTDASFEELQVDLAIEDKDGYNLSLEGELREFSRYARPDAKGLAGTAKELLAEGTPAGSKSYLQEILDLLQELGTAVSALKLRVNPVKCPVLVKLAGEEAPAVMAVGCLMPLANCTNIGGKRLEPTRLVWPKVVGDLRRPWCFVFRFMELEILKALAVGLWPEISPLVLGPLKLMQKELRWLQNQRPATYLLMLQHSVAKNRYVRHHADKWHALEEGTFDPRHGHQVALRATVGSVAAFAGGSRGKQQELGLRDGTELEAKVHTPMLPLVFAKIGTCLLVVKLLRPRRAAEQLQYGALVRGVQHGLRYRPQFNRTVTTMSRVAGIVCAASLALYGASCFIVPTTLPKGAPPTESGAVVGQPSAINGTPESASWSPLAVGAALGLLIAVATGRPALAADLENGEAIFNGNCTACHAGGNNSIVAEKKLKKEALVQYGKYDVQAIITQVTNGNGAMPAFGEKLGPDDIEDVANYVYSKADKW
ncbi:Cytochrome c6 [Symbiodinium microadriaticum]|uniref:Cytochrome c-553 n=1 Tax=Symbiodinium microadriaticum TaxID=2951 RepID=A0A1Q9CD48_SYMMI|nr:Cytochrome c6 [Symbiodinium microadriaticum]